MPRYYERKTTRGNWSPDSMEQALQLALDDGQPLLVCAKNFGIPRNTLRRHWLKKVKKVPGSRHFGRESLLGPAVEVELVQYILKVEERGFGLTPTDVRELVFCPVIELSGGWEGSTPQFIFQPHSLFSKITLGGSG